MQAVVDFRRLGQDFAAFVADPTTEASVAYAKRVGLKVSHTSDIRGKRYHIVRHDKAMYGEGALTMTDEMALVRSIIIADGKIRCVSLPKTTRKMSDAPVVTPGRTDTTKSVLLEGPMINVFYYADDACQGDDAAGTGWQISTRSVFGAKNSFYDDDTGAKLTFRNMFLEAMPTGMTNTLDRGVVYSYVIRHPKNRDVYGVTTPYLVLVASFKPRDETNMVWEYAAPDVAGVLSATNEPSMGITAAWADADGNLVRAKEMSDKYLTLRKLRGTQPKLKFHFLTLRKQRGALTQYLAEFPEHATVFSAFREEIHGFTKQLQANYWECFVKREKQLRDYDGQFKSHMYNLHTQFKQTRKPMNISAVIQYVNSLEPAQLLFSLHWRHRERRSTTMETTTATTTATATTAASSTSTADTTTDMEQ